MSTGGRNLPIRYAPIAGEALDSWLEYLAARLHCRFADVLRSLGLPMQDAALSHPMLPRWTVLSTADEIAAVSGIAEDVLGAMTLRRFDGHAVAIRPDQRRVERRVLWGRVGSRYCPVCLDESDGRWQLSWRLGWSFACTRHHVLLADRCPACHRIPRVRAHPRRETPRPGRCDGPQFDGPRGARCHHLLSDIPVVALEPDGSLVRTQRRTRANHLPNITHAQRWIFHTLTGTPPRLAHPAIAPTTPSQRGSTCDFAGASCPPRSNSSPTPHAPSSTSTASTNPSSGPHASPLPPFAH
ncbi:TniQ family protein [Streptomyces alboflavus]|uniref:TniQ family protein n=1 Tax=Streptomyces alboflavus TaxID=67267 RepID=UPI0036792440